MANQCKIEKDKGESKEKIFMGFDPDDSLTLGQICTAQQSDATISCSQTSNPLHNKSLQITDSYVCEKSPISQLGAAIQYSFQPQVQFLKSLFASNPPNLAKIFQSGIFNEDRLAVLEIIEFCKEHQIDFSEVIDLAIAISDSSLLQSNDGKIAALRAVATLLSLRSANEKSFYFSKIPPSQEENQKFIDTILKLMQERKVHLKTFEGSTTKAAEAVGAQASYRTEEDSVQISNRFSLALGDRAVLVHEFYHFYQDYQKMNDESYVANEMPAYLIDTQYVLHELSLSSITSAQDLISRIQFRKIYFKGNAPILRTDKINPEIAALWVNYDRVMGDHQKLQQDLQNLEEALEQGAILIEIAASYNSAIQISRSGLINLIRSYNSNPNSFDQSIPTLMQYFSTQKDTAYGLLKTRCKEAEKEHKVYIGREGAYLKMPIQDYARIAIVEILTKRLTERLRRIQPSDQNALESLAQEVNGGLNISQEDADSIAKQLVPLKPFSHHIFTKSDGVK